MVDPRDGEPLRLVSHAAEATEALGAWLGERLAAGTLLALDGDLGAGKTCLVRGLARGLGIEGGISSPTYTLMDVHEGGRLPLAHFDAWMEGREKAFLADGGDTQLLGDGVAVVEWAERVGEHLPRPHLALRLAHLGPDLRRVELRRVGPSEALERLLQDLRGDLPQGLELLGEGAESP